MEKLYPKESVKGAHTVLRGSVRAPEGFSEGKPRAAKMFISFFQSVDLTAQASKAPQRFALTLPLSTV